MNDLSDHNTATDFYTFQVKVGGDNVFKMPSFKSPEGGTNSGSLFFSINAGIDSRAARLEYFVI